MTLILCLVTKWHDNNDKNNNSYSSEHKLIVECTDISISYRVYQMLPEETQQRIQIVFPERWTWTDQIFRWSFFSDSIAE